ncbi:MAG: hypothetical protein PVH17_08605 [Anaerolineae bacterium]|jgi:hypothetical protein
MFQTPMLVLSLLLASAYAVAFHLWIGRRWRDLLFFWLAAMVGFATGQVAGQMLEIIPWTIGQVHVVEATLVVFLFLALARWLMREKETK